MILVSVSKKSQSDPWILFEAGAGVQKQNSIPVIWTDMDFSELKFPLAGLQARRLTKPEEFKKLLSDIIKHAHQQRIPWNDQTFEMLASSLKTLGKVTSIPAAVHQAPSPTPHLPKYSKEPADALCEDVFKRLDKLANEVLNEKLVSLKPIYSDLPSATELSRTDLLAKLTLADTVGAFTSGEGMELMAPKMMQVPAQSANPLIKAKFKSDTEDRISKLKKLAARHKLSTSTT